jgi:hypothetical protein
MLGRDMAVDLGTANTLVYVRGRGVVLNEPSVVATRTDDPREAVAFGHEAKKMIGRTPEGTRVVRPVRGGLVADFEATFAKLKRLPCELFLGPHGNFYDMVHKRERQKAGGPNPFIDPAGCKAYIDTGEANFRKKLAADRAKG